MATLIEWPSTLPSFETMEANRYNEVQPDNAWRLPTDSGSTLSRAKSNRAPRTLDVSLVMDEAQTIIFDRFYIETCVQGTLPFRATHPRTRETREFKFRGQFGFQNYDSNNYLLVFQVDVLPE